MSFPLFYFKNLCLTFGQEPLFSNISAQISAKDRYCLIGKNGSGKSTLLKLMAGVIEPDKGELYYQPKARIGYLTQSPLVEKDYTIYEYVSQNVLLHMDETIEQKSYMIDIVLENLGLSKNKLLSKLSGGKLRRADLARTLVSEPDLLFLDEPTNHLDILSIEWLEEYLNNFSGAAVIISHDRTFLSKVSNKTLWIDRGQLLANNSGYNDFERWSEEVYNKEEKQMVRLGKELDKENLWLQQGVTARRKRNQQRLAGLYELRDKIKSEKSRFNNINNQIKLDVSSSDNKAKILVEFEDVGFKFTDVIPEKIILKPFSLSIMKGETIGVMGRNGAGKSTFVKLITDKLKPSEGIIKLGANLEYSYLDQSRSEIDLDKTLWETLCPNGGDTVFLKDRTKHVIAYLKDFLFDQNQAIAKVSTLSGGEQNRLLLAKLLINPGNFLILDEPTNDLDMDTLDMLVEILSDYKGSLLIVSHDRDFLERLVTRTIIIDQGEVHDYVGGYYDYIASIKLNKAVKNNSVQKVYTEKASKKLSYKDERELSLLPEKMEKTSKLISGLESELNDENLYSKNYSRFEEISNQIAKAREELNKDEERWLELEELKLSLKA